MIPLSKSCCLAGVGETTFGRLPGSTALSLNVESCRGAIQDAGLSNREVDGLLAMKSFFDPTFMFSAWIAECLGLSVEYTADLDIGGGTAVSMVKHAALAIAAGLCRTVLCTFGDNWLTAPRSPGHGRLRMGTEDFQQPFGMISQGPPGAIVASARRHMHEYGTTSRQFGAVAVAARKHATLNDRAFRREPITIEDHQSSRLVIEPFRLLDNSSPVDGAASVVVTSEERARDLKQPPVYIRGFGEGYIPRHSRYWIQAPSMTVSGAKRAGEKAFAMADLTPEDVDVAEIYDCFTYVVILQLEDYGFCPKGEGGPFVEEGRIELGGELPVNTHGGLLSEGHVGGMNHITEAVRQLRGKCGARQVRDAEVALVTGFDESALGAALLLGR